MNAQHTSEAGEASHSPIPGPFRSDGNTVKAVSHGQWFTVLRCDNPRFTPEAKQRIAAHVAFVLDTYATLAAKAALADELAEALEEIAVEAPYMSHARIAEFARAALESYHKGGAK